MSLRNKSLPPLDREVLNLREAADSLDRYADGLVSDVARFERAVEFNATFDPVYAEECRQQARAKRDQIARLHAEAIAKRAEAALVLAEPKRVAA